MSSLITKLAEVPEQPEKYQVATGFHLVVLNFKTDKKTDVKRPSVAYVVPKLSTQDDSTILGKATNKWIDSLQRAALAEYYAGEFDYHVIIVDLNALLTEYLTDRRGNRTGPKQSDLIDWIDTTLVPFFTARIDENLTGFTVDQKKNTVDSYVKKFKLAATRGNKAGNETLSDAALKDLEQRMVRWTTNEDEGKNLPNGPEMKCLMERITGHRATIAKSIQEVTTDQF